MDILDRRVLHALFLDGRAPLHRIATVLDAPDAAVTRSYRRLCAEYAVRVAARLDPRRLGQQEWIVRIHCVPQFALAVARALARQPNTRRVRLGSGGAEILCNVVLDDGDDTETLLLDRLPHARGVTGVDAHRVLHVFGGGPVGGPGPWDALSAEQAAALRLAPPPQRPDGYRLDAGDRVLVDLLGGDGRASGAALAAATGWHESTVRRRLAALRASGALYFTVDFDERSLGLTCGASIWLAVRPTELPAVGTALAGHREIPFVAATTGSHNIHAAVLCADGQAFYDYLTTRIGALPGIGMVTTAPIIRTVKRSVVTA